MMNLMNQNSQIIDLKNENDSLKTSVRNLGEELDANKVKVSILDYNLKSADNEDFLPTDSIVISREERHQEWKTRFCFRKLADKETKKKIIKKKELASSTDPKIKELKVMNYKTQEQIILENALRGVLANGSNYELNGNMRLVTKQS